MFFHEIPKKKVFNRLFSGSDKTDQSGENTFFFFFFFFQASLQWGSFILYARKIFGTISISYCAYQGVNVSFSENFA